MISLIHLIDRFLGLSDKEKSVRQAINELNALSDRDLDDLGIARGNIANVVRNGRKGDEFNDYHAV